MDDILFGDMRLWKNNKNNGLKIFENYKKKKLKEVKISRFYFRRILDNQQQKIFLIYIFFKFYIKELKLASNIILVFYSI